MKAEELLDVLSDVGERYLDSSVSSFYGKTVTTRPGGISALKYTSLAVLFLCGALVIGLISASLFGLLPEDFPRNNGGGMGTAPEATDRSGGDTSRQENSDNTPAEGSGSYFICGDQTVYSVSGFLWSETTYTLDDGTVQTLNADGDPLTGIRLLSDPPTLYYKSGDVPAFVNKTNYTLSRIELILSDGSNVASGDETAGYLDSHPGEYWLSAELSFSGNNQDGSGFKAVYTETVRIIAGANDQTQTGTLNSLGFRIERITYGSMAETDSVNWDFDRDGRDDCFSFSYFGSGFVQSYLSLSRPDEEKQEVIARFTFSAGISFTAESGGRPVIFDRSSVIRTGDGIFIEPLAYIDASEGGVPNVYICDGATEDSQYRYKMNDSAYVSIPLRPASVPDGKDAFSEIDNLTAYTYYIPKSDTSEVQIQNSKVTSGTDELYGLLSETGDKITQSSHAIFGFDRVLTVSFVYRDIEAPGDNDGGYYFCGEYEIWIRDDAFYLIQKTGALHGSSVSVGKLDDEVAKKIFRLCSEGETGINFEAEISDLIVSRDVEEFYRMLIEKGCLDEVGRREGISPSQKPTDFKDYTTPELENEGVKLFRNLDLSYGNRMFLLIGSRIYRYDCGKGATGIYGMWDYDGNGKMDLVVYDLGGVQNGIRFKISVINLKSGKKSCFFNSDGNTRLEQEDVTVSEDGKMLYLRGVEVKYDGGEFVCDADAVMNGIG